LIKPTEFLQLQTKTRNPRAGEDEICQHYAVKTIENICSQGGEWAATFSTQVGLI
jgi:serine/threonine-protein kinase ULK4